MRSRLISPSTRSRTSAGMTLIETLVALVAALIVFGAVLDLYGVTSAASLRAVRREGVWADARQLGRLLDASLRGYVSPDQLSYSDNPRTDRFDENGAEFFHSDPAPGPTIWKFTVAPAEVAPAEEGNGVERRRGVQASRTSMGSGGEEKPEPPWNYGDPQTDVRLALRYAYSFEGLQPVWTDKPQPGARPRLVQYEITAQDAQDTTLRARVVGAVALK